ncbi:CvpA family protein [Comamonas composti]|uniref:CvpA family protein n=1 Tax=Comamonas composti TaxID=408558 RepID=UPI00040FDD58|nr:CvpA family protein [Comamonas composti]
MTTLDWIVLAGLLASMLLGAWRGLVYELLSLAGWLVAFGVARIWGGDMGLWLPLEAWDAQLRYAAGFVLLFVLTLFAWGLLSWLARQLIDAVGLRPVDRALGALFGALRGLVLTLVAAMVILSTPLHEGQWWQDSASAPWLLEAVTQVLPQLPQGWEQYLPRAARPG